MAIEDGVSVDVVLGKGIVKHAISKATNQCVRRKDVR